MQDKLSKTSDQLGDCINMAQGYVDVHKGVETNKTLVEEDLLEDEYENNE